MKLVVLCNAQLCSERGRSAGPLALIASTLEKIGQPVEIRQADPAGLRAAADEAVRGGADVVAAIGGDGTLSTVAAALVDKPAALGIVPLGTFNHFARDLGIPLAIEPAVRILAAGCTRRVDVGEVNGRTFINNASIGAYPRMVLDRRQQQIRLGRSKWRAMLHAGWHALRRFPQMEVRLALADDAPWCSTPCVFVGNNTYRFDLLAPGRRPALDRGRLGLYVLRAPSRLAVLRLGLKAALGKLAQDGNLITVESEEFWIDCRRRHVHLGCDGEVFTLLPPLHFRSRPRALTVVVPPPDGRD